MATKQGSLDLLNDPVAQDLLQSTHSVQLAYVWPDGTPRVVPIWFHWNGQAFVIGTPTDAPKIKALAKNPNVALTVNSETWPDKVLLVRGAAQVEIVDGVSPEYAASAKRYFGEEQGRTWVEQVGNLLPQMARITVQPEWVGILDFEQRFPSALQAAMDRAQAG